jgi:hypothetical protein
VFPAKGTEGQEPKYCLQDKAYEVYSEESSILFRYLVCVDKLAFLTPLHFSRASFFVVCFVCVCDNDTTYHVSF